MSYTSPFTGDVIIPTDVSYQNIALTADLTLVWSPFATSLDTVAARIMDVTPNASGRSLIMPPANQVSVGQDALIRNYGSNTFTVKDAFGGTICSVASGQAQYIYVTDNTTVAGVWHVIAFGAGTSSADASTLAGLGLLAISSTLNQSHPASTFSTGYTFLAADRAQAKVWAGGAGTATLPLASTLGNNWFTLFKNNGTGSLIISCSGSDLIDGATTKTFAPSESAFIICDGTNFITVGYGQSINFVFSALVKPVTSGTYNITPSEASNTIQEYVGNLSGNVIAVYPAAVNFYVISNQVVANGFTLTITTGVSGGANAIIPAGQQVTLICDGTNFLNANTVQAGATAISLINGSVGTPALNFGSETGTGIYRPGTGELAIAVLGSQIVDVISTGITVTGTGTFTGGVAGGVFP